MKFTYIPYALHLKNVGSLEDPNNEDKQYDWKCHQEYMQLKGTFGSGSAGIPELIQYCELLTDKRWNFCASARSSVHIQTCEHVLQVLNEEQYNQTATTPTNRRG